jgi:adenine phosphoribosyltransferase
MTFQSLSEASGVGDEVHNQFESLIRTVPDFPEPGILFRDVTPLLGNARAFHEVIHRLGSRFMGQGLDAIVAIEARGFIFGSALATRLNLGFVPVRKPGKLPYLTTKTSYSLEYGKAELEIHTDAIGKGSRVLIVDDVLATGGTAAAATRLVQELGGSVGAYAFVIELAALAGRARLAELGASEVCSLLTY